MDVIKSRFLLCSGVSQDRPARIIGFIIKFWLAVEKGQCQFTQPEQNGHKFKW